MIVRHGLGQICDRYSRGLQSRTCLAQTRFEALTAPFEKWRVTLVSRFSGVYAIKGMKAAAFLICILLTTGTRTISMSVGFTFFSPRR